MFMTVMEMLSRSAVNDRAMNSSRSKIFCRTRYKTSSPISFPCPRSTNKRMSCISLLHAALSLVLKSSGRLVLSRLGKTVVEKSCLSKRTARGDAVVVGVKLNVLANVNASASSLHFFMLATQARSVSVSGNAALLLYGTQPPATRPGQPCSQTCVLPRF